jgi:hypothetical protein
MTRLAAAFLLLLAGCDKPVTRSEAQDIAADYAPDLSEINDRLDRLERDLADLKRAETADATYMVANDKSQAANIDQLTYNVDVLKQHINILRNANGWQPMAEKK